jgi:hypothetical protein
MFTYQMTIVNEDNCQKIVYVNGASLFDAVNSMRKEYGRSWSVFSYKLVSSNY